MKKYLLIGTTSFTVIALIIAWFYWFQYRPTQIRHSCSLSIQDSIDKLKEFLQNKPYSFGPDQAPAFVDLKHLEYTNCLHLNGLNE